MLSTKPYYVSTPIFYVNAAPHIGHLYTSVIADVINRYSSLCNPDRATFLNTGTDEHGLKIQRAAQSAGMEPGEFCDRISKRFKHLALTANVNFNRFIRTTDDDHNLAARHFWQELKKSGAIYKGEHSGWYSVSDECFYTDSQIRPPDPPSLGGHVPTEATMISIETGNVVEWTKEHTYKFRLSAYREPLLKWIKGNPKSVYPSTRRLELLEYLSDRDSMPDLSISRPRKRLQWGIPVPDDEEHTIYVWLEALVNYLTAVGYPWSDGKGDDKGWPTDVHVIGKDITRFHAVLFPCFLLCLQLPLPKTILAHGHWTVDRMKMSKSRGNVADPTAALDVYGADGVRYFLMRAGGNLRSDADWSEEQLKTVYNHELCNAYGNLLGRTTSRKFRHALAVAREHVHTMPHGPASHLSYSSLLEDQVGTYQAEDQHIKRILHTSKTDVGQLMDEFEFGRALGRIQQCLVKANEYMTQLAWWHNTLPEARKGGGSATLSLNSGHPGMDIQSKIAILRRTHLYSHESLRIASILLQPFMPAKAAIALNILGIDGHHRDWSDAVLGAELRIEREAERYNSEWGSLFPPLACGGKTSHNVVSQQIENAHHDIVL